MRDVKFTGTKVPRVVFPPCSKETGIPNLPSFSLIRFAHCADCSKDCPESYYGGGWESDLHVHHLTYKNRGCERYEDLELLCKRHHEHRHELVEVSQ